MPWGSASVLGWLENLRVRSALGAKVEGGLRALPEGSLSNSPSRGCPTQNGISQPLFGLFPHFSASSHPPFRGDCFWSHLAISSQLAACPQHLYPLGPGEGLVVLRVH